MQYDLSAIRNKLYDYIRVADDKKIQAIYHLLQDEIDKEIEWWEDKKTLTELDNQYKDLVSGKDKGVTVDQLKNSLAKLSQKKHGK